MSDTLKFMGTWNPTLGTFPVIQNDINACYYLVTGTGEVGGYQFEEGDWLIYAEEPVSPTESHGKWYRSTGGIVQVATVGSEQSSIAADPGIYTKITVNNAGIVTEGDFLRAEDLPTHQQEASTITGFEDRARTSIGPMFVNTARSKAVEFEYDETTKTMSADVKVDGVTITKNRYGELSLAEDLTHPGQGNGPPGHRPVDDDGDRLFPPEPHTHQAKDISDFQDQVRNALAHNRDGTNPFFSNTARSNAVAFNYDVATATVSADVKIDNSTIIKNKYGQLVAIAADIKPHTHTVEDIVGLDNLQSLQPAGKQTLTLPSDGTYTDGLYNFEGHQINDAFDLVNISLQNITHSLTEIDVNVEKIKPVPPPQLSDVFLELEDYEHFDVHRAGVGDVVSAIFDSTPRTKATERFAGGESGILEAFVDDRPAGAITIRANANDEGQASGQVGSLIITENVDFYEGLPAFQGWYTSLRAAINVTTNLEPGPHTLKLVHSETGESHPLEVHIANVVNDPSVASDTVNFDVMPAMSKYVSGVPAAESLALSLESFRVEGAVSKYYNPIGVARITSGSATLAHEDVVLDAINVPAESGYLETEPTSIEFLPQYNEHPTIHIYARNIFGTEDPVHLNVWPQQMRIDPSDESRRVTSGPASEIYPGATCGMKYDSTEPLWRQDAVGIIDSPYFAELQLINSRYRWPDGDYSHVAGGPDYTNAPGVRLSIDPTGPLYRWVTIAQEVDELMAFDLHLRRANGEWPLTLNKTIPNLRVYARVVDECGWVDCNRPFPGVGAAYQDGDGALDVSKSSQEIRRVTFGSGAGPFTGTLLIRIGVAKDSGYEIDEDILVVPAGD